MITACYYTLIHIISVLERGNYEEIVPFCNKILNRYRNDSELQSVCPLVQKYVKNGRDEDLKNIITKLKELAEIRRVCVSSGVGGELLWLKKRRP